MTAPADHRDNAARQRAHWDGVLSADNIGAAPQAARAVEREIPFTGAPDFAVLRRALAQRTDPLVLDLGGGLGVHAVALARDGHRVVVADVSGARLLTLARVLAELGLREHVSLVQTAAERLSLRTESIDVVWTKSVLIHTQIEKAAREIARCLSPGGEAVLSEPTDANPLVRLYRRLLAPKEWESITRYFTAEREAVVLGALRDARAERFHVLGFLAFVWQFALRSALLFRLSLAVLDPVDRMLMRFWPAWRRRAWLVVMTGRRPSS